MLVTHRACLETLSFRLVRHLLRRKIRVHVSRRCSSKEKQNIVTYICTVSSHHQQRLRQLIHVAFAHDLIQIRLTSTGLQAVAAGGKAVIESVSWQSRNEARIITQHTHHCQRNLRLKRAEGCGVSLKWKSVIVPSYLTLKV